MKKTAWILAAALALLALAGCGKKPLDEKALQQAVESYDQYAWMEAKTKDFEVVKRQTDEDDKTDIAWVTIQGETDAFTVTRSFEMHSTLYNDGWELEEIYPWHNEQAPDSLAPSSVPTEEMVREYVEGLDLASYCSFSYVECPGISEPVTPVTGEITNLNHPQEAEITEYEAYDTWNAVVRFHSDLLDEVISLPIYYYFDFERGGWQPSLGNTEDLYRSFFLNEAAVGTWKQQGEYLDVTFEVLSIDADGAGCDVTFKYQTFGRYPRSGHDGGHLALEVVEDQARPRLIWDDGGDHVNYHDLDENSPANADPNIPIFNIYCRQEASTHFSSTFSNLADRSEMVKAG